MTTKRSSLRVALSHVSYAVVAHLACLLAAPVWLLRVWRDRRQLLWIRRRFGQLPEGLPTGRPVWIHAVSVGEVKASRPLVAALREQHAELPLVLSTGTPTGFDTARRLFPDLYVFPLPLDLHWVVARAMRRVDPRLIILLELEVWPALMKAADEAGVPQVIVNGRVSESSFRSYRRLKWWLPEFERIDWVGAQDAAIAERIANLGVPRERIDITGNLKHDLSSEPSRELVAGLGRELGLDDGRPVFVAGSTHDGEDGPVVRAWRAAGGSTVAHLVLVPRHLDRVKEIGRLLRQLEVPAVLRSEAGSAAAAPSGDSVLLVDTMGELEALFGLADVVFLGGTLVPVGGHNVLEPAAAGCPVLVGPHLESCRNDAQTLRAAGGLRIVEDEGALGDQLRVLLADPRECKAMGSKASQAVRQLKGATATNLRLLREKDLLRGGRLEGFEKSDTLVCSPGHEPSPHPAPRTGAPLP